MILVKKQNWPNMEPEVAMTNDTCKKTELAKHGARGGHD